MIFLKKQDKVIITSALIYANGEVHLGHIASTYLPADIFARYYRLRGADTLFVCGTDDFGTPILIRAEQEGKSPEEFVNYWKKRDEEDFSRLGISFDIFDQTSSKENIEFVQQFFRTLYGKGFISKQVTELLFCEHCNRFLPDRYVKGTCPFCGAEEQYSDGCDRCGKIFQQGEIISPHCAICGSKPVVRSSEHYFFKLSVFSDQLKKWLEENHNLQDDVKNYVLNWIEDGLLDWDITRDISWGVPIQLEEAEGKVLYGWFDNHLGYISTTLKYLKRRGIDGKEFWNSAKTYHFIGKDIVYHHYLFLPAMRLGEGGFNLPDFIPVRGHLLLQGRKFSKSRDWYISLRDFLDDFPADYLRYYFSTITPYSQSDINFNWKDFQAHINNELVATVGNFIYRALKFTETRFACKVPEPRNFNKIDKEFEEKIKTVMSKVGSDIEKNELNRALKKIVEFGAECNQFFQKKEPWKNADNVDNCIFLSINAVYTLSILIEPYLPFAAKELWEQLNISGNTNNQKWSLSAELKIKSGHKLNKPKILFKKIEDEEIEKEVNKLKD